MSCGCKGDNIIDTNEEKSIPEEMVGAYAKVSDIVISTIMFAILLPISVAVVVPFTIYMLARLIFLKEGGVDMTATLKEIGSFLKRDKEEEDEEPVYEFNEEDEYQIVGIDTVDTNLN